MHAVHRCIMCLRVVVVVVCPHPPTHTIASGWVHWGGPGWGLNVLVVCTASSEDWVVSLHGLDTGSGGTATLTGSVGNEAQSTIVHSVVDRTRCLLTLAYVFPNNTSVMMGYG